ncbi:MAG TPA: aspartyl protease family protein [Candidatus Eremiobacteraceae bacterium]
MSTFRLNRYIAAGFVAAVAATSIMFVSRPETTVADIIVPAASPSASASPDTSIQPPAGVKASTKTLAQVLSLYEASLGKAAGSATSRETATIVGRGMTETDTELRSGGDYVLTSQVGQVTTAEGRAHGQQWRQDENGYTRMMTGIHSEDQRSADALQKAMHGDPSLSVRLLGEVSVPVRAYVVELDPDGGRLEWLFFETTSGRLVRREESIDRVRVVWTFDDFRATDGVVQPWHEHYTDTFVDDELDKRTTQLAYGVSIPQNALAIPASSPRLRFPPGVTDVRVPAIFGDDGGIIVRITIAGRGLDLALDSGTYDIVIDSGTASSLGLVTFKNRGHTTSTSAETTSAVVPQMTIGPLSMQNVAIECLPFTDNPDAAHKVVGLLGYDFFAGVVVKVDYLNHTVDAIDPAAFKPPPGQSFTVPVRLDDRVPMIDAWVGSGSAGNFIVDTGSVDLAVSENFVKANAHDLAHLSYQYKSQLYYPIEFREGVGGVFDVVKFQARTFQIGQEEFGDVGLVEADQFVSGEDLDGLVGYPILEYFDLYFDYENATLVLQPNALITKAAPQ